MIQDMGSLGKPLRSRSNRLLIVAASALTLVSIAAAALAQEVETVTGTATISTDSEPRLLPNGLALRFDLLEGDVSTPCGTARVGQNGGFSVDLAPDCAVEEGDALDVSLVGIEGVTTSVNFANPLPPVELVPPEGEGFRLLASVMVGGAPAQAGTTLALQVAAEAEVCQTIQITEGGGFFDDISGCFDDSEPVPLVAALPESGLASQQIAGFADNAQIEVAALDFTALQRGGEVDYIDPMGVATPLPAGLSITFLRDQEVCGTSSLGGNGVYGLSLAEPCVVNEDAEVRLVAQPLIQTTVNLGAVRDLPVHLGYQDTGTPLFGTAIIEQGNELAMGSSIRFDLREGQTCGRAEIEAQGSFVAIISSDCSPGAAVNVISEELSLQGTTNLPAEGQPSRVDITLSEAAEEPRIVTPEQLEANPLIQAGELQKILIFLIVGVLGVFSFVLLERYHEQKRSHKILMEKVDWISKDDLLDYFESGKLFTRTIIEGVVLTMVVIALVILAVTGKVTPGSVSVLAAIIGYAAGRMTSTST